MLKRSGEDTGVEALQELQSPLSVPVTSCGGHDRAYSQPWRKKVKVRAPSEHEPPVTWRRAWSYWPKRRNGIRRRSAISPGSSIRIRATSRRSLPRFFSELPRAVALFTWVTPATPNRPSSNEQRRVEPRRIAPRWSLAISRKYPSRPNEPSAFAGEPKSSSFSRAPLIAARSRHFDRASPFANVDIITWLSLCTPLRVRWGSPLAGSAMTSQKPYGWPSERAAVHMLAQIVQALTPVTASVPEPGRLAPLRGAQQAPPVTRRTVPAMPLIARPMTISKKSTPSSAR